jgi:signal transduction histidine kinase
MQKYIHPDDQEFVKAKISEAIETKGMFELEHRIMRADGTFGWTYSRAVPILDEQGKILEWFGAAADVSRRKLAEDAVVKSEKLIAMGRLAGTIAHEINNPLEAAMNIIYLLRKNNSFDSQTQLFLKTLQDELSRISRITRQSLGFYRESSKLVEVSLAAILDEVLELLKRKAQDSGVTTDRRYSTQGSLLSFPGEMRQIFLNLIGNSIEAMPRGGRLRVHLYASRNWNYSDSSHGFRVNVCDTGSGISRETAKKIFEPFFTTKEDKGTGLGLWVTRGIIHKHEGSIRFRSLRIAGKAVTCFSVFLPFPTTRVNDRQFDLALRRGVEQETARK